ncbi:Alpha-(1,3)-fucosyltransferase C [Strongyloides ratti]|uniref:Fucosyltransferase n=1 Tax=Strongyloides ratti TaxID=34506 RepID=A0A090MYE0_STRRB|nr:Alpha-(1,3)-fucosyltransferase C [Strongyloides ratti]CEF67019.1 Alpha-(1,3)-fucosyltransferase C [Strongyloides ratti]
MILLSIFLFASLYVHVYTKFTILSWNKNKYFYNNSNCTVLNCKVIFNRNKIQYVNAILFEEHYSFDKQRAKINFPKRNNNKILNVYTSISSPIPTIKNDFKRNYKLPLNYFNLIFSYNSKSDIIFTYGGPWFYDKKLQNETFNFNQNDIFKNKNLPVVWINKDCTLNEGQKRVINNLKSKIKLEEFKRCDKQNLNTTNKTIKDFYEKYYFYIVMDEADCKDYLTISYWEASTFNIVPIVTARRNYQNILPQSSFIAMDDYKNADEMVFYLNFLMENKIIYSRYFEYRKKGWTLEKKPYDYNICNLCKKLIEFRSKNSHEKFKNIQMWILQNNQCLKKNYISRYWKILY